VNQFTDWRSSTSTVAVHDRRLRRERSVQRRHPAERGLRHQALRHISVRRRARHQRRASPSPSGPGQSQRARGLFQLNGHTPNANGCAGDSGGPAIRNFDGQERTWGVGSWTTPRLECVAPPHGTNKQFAADTTSQRPSQFLPGNHPYVFGTSFSAGPTRSWRLSAPNSPTTTLTVDSSSPRCPANTLPTACAQSCDAQIAACPGSRSLEGCT